MNIPRILHQTWKNEEIPDSFRQLAQSWKDQHPGWEYTLWTDETNRNFIAVHFPYFLPVYDGYSTNIQRVDAVRYFILYKYGGFFIDLDFECLANIEPIADDATCIFGYEPREHCEIHNKELIISNAFMGAVPGSLFFEALCSELTCNRVITDHPNDNVLETTGPFMLSRLYEGYERKSDIKLLDPCFMYPLTKDELDELNEGGQHESITRKLTKAYGIHHYAGTWWKKSTTV